MNNENKKYDISICIPVYNADAYLEQCLNSVLTQTKKNIQVVCVNDGSTDNSLKILKKFEKKYNNIKIINQKNKGVVSARICCLENANGKYIGWVDADDFIENDMYEKMYNKAIETDADIVICDYNFYPKSYSKKRKWFKEYKGKVDWKFISFNTIQWNKIVKRTLLNQINISNLFKTMGEGCYAIAMVESKKIVTLEEKLYNYRVGHVSLSNNFNNIDWYKKNVEKNYLKYKYICDNNYGEYWENYFKFIYLYYVLSLMIVSAYNDDKDEYQKNKNIIKKEKMFWNNNSDYLNHYIGKNKKIFLKYIGMKSFLLLKVVSKIVFD